MSEGGKSRPERQGRSVGEALRTAVERTLDATAGSTADTRERAAELLDEVARRGREARDELARRGQEAGAGLVRRGQVTSGELARRLEALEDRLASIEELLRREGEQKPVQRDEPNPKGEG